MRNLITVFFTYFYFPLLIAQPHASWLNYSYSQRVTDIDVKGNDVWISTQGGLVKYNKKSSEKTYYNRANSNLPDNNLLGLFCCSNGDVWLSSKHYGIGKLSTNQCTIYNQSNSDLPSNQLNTKIKIDNLGNVWIASFRWMVNYDGSIWKKWITGSDLSPFPIVSDFVIDNNDIVWISSTDGLGKIKNNEYSIVPGINGGINQCIEIDNNGNIWISIDGRGLYKYDGTVFTNYTAENCCLPSNNIYAISFDTKNGMWLATAEGLVNFNLSDCDTYQPSPLERSLHTIKCDNNDTIWCGSFSGKLLCFNGADFNSIDLSNSPMNDNYILDILIDNENNSWIGTRKNVVKKTDINFYSVFNKQANALAKDNEGSIWLAFDTGDTCLLKMDKEESIILDSINSPFNTKKISITYLAFDNNNQLWISTNGSGLYNYDGISFTNFNIDNSNIPSNTVFQISFDKDNVLWGGSANGLFKYDGTNFTVWDTGNCSIPTNVVNSLTIDSENKIWFSCMDENRIIGGEFGGGLTRFDRQTMTTYNMSNSSIQANTIFGILAENDKIWLATYGAGLMHFDKNSKWVSYNVTNSGIADNKTQGLAIDNSGNLWIGHNDAGISVFNPDSAIQTLNNVDANNFTSIIFPNPVKNDLFVKVNTINEQQIQIGIYDLNGRLILNLSEKVISIENSTIHLQVGNLLQTNQVYILTLRTSNGDYYNTKFIYVN